MGDRLGTPGVLLFFSIERLPMKELCYINEIWHIGGEW